MKAKIAVLAGDGIGPEVMAEAVRVLRAIERRYGHEFSLAEGLVGGAAFDRYKSHFPDETRKICSEADAILFGSVGGPVKEQHLEKWKNCEANSLLAIRKTFGFAANLRPAKVYPALAHICPLKPEIALSGVDILIIRELLGDLYFGEHARFSTDGVRVARDVAIYDERQIARVATVAFQSALKRKKRVTSIDKANVLETGKLWREVVTEVSKQYSDVTLEHMLVDNCAMQLIRAPAQFDVILCPNMFGDILSDEAAVLPGSLGLTPSASLGEGKFGFYEPSGGSAPDIAGKGIANPTAQILSLALLFRHSLDLENEARAIELAVDKVLDNKLRTQDIFAPGDKLVSTKEYASALIAELEAA